MAALTTPLRRTAASPGLKFRGGGFTLTELAIVMFIVALLIGGMVLPLTAQQNLRQRQETEAQLAQIKEALIGFAIVNGRLPRPAASATDGAERAAACGTDANCSGYLPWSALGTPHADAWGHLFRYSVTPAFADGAITLLGVPNRNVQSRDAAGATYYVAGKAACATASDCVPAVVFSQGKLRWGTDESGTALPDGSATNNDEDINENGPTAYVSRTATEDTGATGGEFDDVVTWISGNILISRLVAAGKL